MDKLPLNGQKTYVAGGLAITIGLASFILNFISENPPVLLSNQESFGALVTGLITLGIGHKLQKLLESIKFLDNQTNQTNPPLK
jgi:hypothetical protein